MEDVFCRYGRNDNIFFCYNVYYPWDNLGRIGKGFTKGVIRQMNSKDRNIIGFLFFWLLFNIWLTTLNPPKWASGIIAFLYLIGFLLFAKRNMKKIAEEIQDNYEKIKDHRHEFGKGVFSAKAEL